jgi:hypothetical protein
VCGRVCMYVCTRVFFGTSNLLPTRQTHNTPCFESLQQSCFHTNVHSVNGHSTTAAERTYAVFFSISFAQEYGDALCQTKAHGAALATVYCQLHRRFVRQFVLLIVVVSLDSSESQFGPK